MSRGIHLLFNCSDNNISTYWFGDINGSYARGIYLSGDCDYNNVSTYGFGDINAINSTGARGIYLLTGCDYNNVSTHEFGDINGSHTRGIYLLDDCDYNNVSTYGFGDINGSTAQGINITINCDNNTITTNGFGNITSDGGATSYGIYLSSSNHNNITTDGFGNITSQNGDAFGVNLSESSNNNIANFSVMGVNASDDAYGIVLRLSDDNNFSSNSLYNINGSGYACGVHLSKSDGNVFGFTNISGVHANTVAYGVTISSVPSGSNNNVFNTGQITDVNAPTWWSIYSCEYSKNNSFALYTLSSYPTTVSFTYGNGMKMKSVDIPPPDPADWVNIGKYVNITNLTLASWVNLSVHYEDSDVPHLVVEHILEIWKHNGSWYKDGWANWKSLDTMINMVSANITDFGSIFAPLQPIPPNIVDPKVAVDMNGPPLEQGDMICYTAWINNTGGMDSTDNLGNEFEDPIPDHTTYVPGSLTINDVSNDDSIADGIGYDSGNDMIIWNGIIPAYGSIKISFCVTVDLDVPDGVVISNQGVVYYDSDGGGTNDAQKPTDDPSTTLKDDPTIIRIPLPSQVPGFTPIGMLLLIGLISLLAVIVIRRKGK